jgi:hypothetical protein
VRRGLGESFLALGLASSTINVTALSMRVCLGLALRGFISCASGSEVCVWHRVHRQSKPRRALAAARTSQTAATTRLRVGGGGVRYSRQKSRAARFLGGGGREWAGQVAGLGAAVGAGGAAHVCGGMLLRWPRFCWSVLAPSCETSVLQPIWEFRTSKFMQRVGAVPCQGCPSVGVDTGAKCKSLWGCFVCGAPRGWVLSVGCCQGSSLECCMRRAVCVCVVLFPIGTLEGWLCARSRMGLMHGAGAWSWCMRLVHGAGACASGAGSGSPGGPMCCSQRSVCLWARVPGSRMRDAV